MSEHPGSARAHRAGQHLATDTEIAAVPTGTVVRAADTTIAARFDAEWGVVSGDDRPFPWDVPAPALVLWSTSDETTIDG